MAVTALIPRSPSLALTFLLALCFVFLPWSSQAEGENPIQDLLRQRLSRLEAPLVIGGQQLSAEVLERLYALHAFAPLWTKEGGLSARGQELLLVLDDAKTEGLNPDKYLPAGLRNRLDSRQLLTDNDAADLELLLSMAGLAYVKDAALGQSPPQTSHQEVALRHESPDVVAILHDAVTADDFGARLRAVVPAHEGYARLREALGRYRAVAAKGGWPTVSSGPKLQLGSTGPRVLALRRRLALTDEVPLGTDKDNVFDARLDEAVRKVQARHGLVVDGVVGKNTLAALNVPVTERIRQILFNMERWRWLPRDLGSRYIFINAAGFYLEIFEGDKQVLDMKVVVGRPYRSTPIFRSQLTHVTFNPTWYVPPKIAVQDLLPKIRKDPGYLRRGGFQVYARSSSSQQIDPNSVDWSAVSSAAFPFKLRQTPGPKNAMGRMKFLLPNPYGIYLHDTPHRELFSRSVRTFSSGCIRLSEPEVLAMYLLQDASGWNEARIKKALQTRRTQSAELANPLPVYFVYLTAWVDQTGEIHFREDIYNRDDTLEQSLQITLDAAASKAVADLS